MKRSCSVMFFAVFSVASSLLAQDRPTTSVAQIVVCNSVVNKQPVGTDSVFAADVKQLSCYTKIISQADESVVSHVWFYQDKQMTKIDLKVKGRSFHTWSTKTIIPKWRGDWRVEVQDASGNVLAKTSFKVQ